MDQIVDVDAVIVTHTHPDHWDDAAVARVPKDLPLFVQNQKDRALIESAGFSDVHVLTEGTTFKDVSLTKTPGQHGSDQAYAAIGEMLGEVCGVVFKHPREKILYVAGDTVWNVYVQDSLRAHQPDVIV
jgi:L-ascorbate metabolism protein UlaG (beta-lactamase superfamily)